MSSNLLENNPFETAGNYSKPLLLDGAIGSYLQEKGFETDDILWTTKINQSNPEAVMQVHNEYVEAGADIVTTNTFRTNISSLSKAGIADSSRYVAQAVGLTRQAVRGKKVYIAGSNAPAEDCYQVERTITNKQLLVNHSKHIDLLIDNGVDFILNETQSHFDEIQIICEHCDRNKIPYVISLYVDETLMLLSGENLAEVISLFNNTSVLAVGLNCILPELFIKVIGSTYLPDNWGFYLNCGSGLQTDKIIKCGIRPDEYLESVKKALLYKPSFIGSCCGSSPAHTKRIREFLDGQNSS